MYKVYGINVFSLPSPLPIKEYVLTTWFKVDDYGWPLM